MKKLEKKLENSKKDNEHEGETRDKIILGKFRWIH